MASKKRPPGPDLIPNPFVKKRNLDWTLEPPVPSSLISHTADSVPVTKPEDFRTNDTPEPQNEQPTTAAIEAGNAHIDDHVTHFSTHLSKYLMKPPSPPPLSIDAYAALYSANANNPRGAHFVIHQHDHPIAGTHYDLRLQINETSSASWAIMYGLPGDPNSLRLNRNATETRIHSLWVRHSNLSLSTPHVSHPVLTYCCRTTSLKLLPRKQVLFSFGTQEHMLYSHERANTHLLPTHLPSTVARHLVKH